MFPLDENTRTHLRRLQRFSKDKRIYIKSTVLLMLDQGFPAPAIAAALGIDDSTVYRYQKRYEEEGLDNYLATFYKAYTGRLSACELKALSSLLDESLYISCQEIGQLIASRFDKAFSLSGIRYLLKRLGFTYKKTRSVPSKADPASQQEFLETFFQLLKGLKSNEVIYFNDAVHPLHNTRSDFGWIRKGHQFPIPANPGRKRLNLNGALNPCDPTDIVVTESERVNAQSTIDLWETLGKRNPGKTIYNICDNAGYYRGEKVTSWLKENTWCHIIFLPPYSPNLNLIERLWKYMRKEITSYNYYETFREFRRAVLSFFDNIKDHKKQLETLLTLKFHIPQMT